ncbi:Maf family nucleotide pyrophosphatase [Paenalcaligenes niemegkensis]|uniref:Maf family nucleotide pyrophosphatase n=1 Tax=Paenalcaligenes niemegkensis TaxID=2895469 RepID=UPI001EE7FBE8|nr:Maf family nucleotide pyrophosphatase [Paenalcaligenes niemegkensis]MCQ9616893.1 Maf family nucleotide pyrophosphatase [Paenalcaligenes niemegkensis]
MRLILASGSPYRRDMLQRLALPFEVITSNVDETPQLDETPEALSLRLSQEKAMAVAKHHPDAIVIGSDQVAALGKLAIGKAGSYDLAVEQLQQLSGQTVVFHSSLCVALQDRLWCESVPTTCAFKRLSLDEIHYYLRHDKPFDTAGSAKAESLGIALMESMHSDDPTAIIGLPLIALSRLLRKVGLNPCLAPGHSLFNS